MNTATLRMVSDTSRFFLILSSVSFPAQRRPQGLTEAFHVRSRHFSALVQALI